ncbi:MAG TPA: hypothetical protein VGC67_15450 [Cellulomonas sp.]
MLRWFGMVLLALVGAAIVIDGFWWLGTVVSNHGGNPFDAVGFLLRVAVVTGYAAVLVRVARGSRR